MGIGTAIQKGRVVYVKDERGRHLWQHQVGLGPRDGLVGYTGTTVSIRSGSHIHIRDERGRQVGTTHG